MPLSYLKTPKILVHQNGSSQQDWFSFLQIIIEIPYIFIQTVVYGVIVYDMIGFDWTVSKFYWYLFFMYFSLYFTFYGMMTMAMTPNHHVAVTFICLLYITEYFLRIRHSSDCKFHSFTIYNRYINKYARLYD